MTSTTGQSQRRDPEDHTRAIDADTGEIRLSPGSAPGVYATPEPATWTMSGLLASALFIAVPLLLAVIVLTVIEEVRNSDVVSENAMGSLRAGCLGAWIGAVLIACRDRLVRCIRSLRVSNETMQNRQLELYRRQDHLARRFNDYANRQLEQVQLLRSIAEDMAAVRRDMIDVIGVADADAELNVRQAVNGNRSASGLYVVPPER
ncbi:hypothetical protein [Micromonospora tarensis]|uniref:Uncharacterized protein n=1 Tax=Micromonospora tarensis TaxID=2806100 RepID=A0ABS1YDD8_9ACTN|nr:hypothetical protein [Micromonospora tarensis]MBM0275367.1 hypothetical protein [Micromonospora tarensis]